jgi:hypothetical protein
MVLVLVATGHSMAIARGMPGAAGYAEYCIGETSVKVAVDAEGNPTGGSHICPDFSLSLLNWVDQHAPALPVIPSKSRSERPQHIAAFHVSRRLSATARGPPVRS